MVCVDIHFYCAFGLRLGIRMARLRVNVVMMRLLFALCLVTSRHSSTCAQDPSWDSNWDEHFEVFDSKYLWRCVDVIRVLPLGFFKDGV